MEVVPADGDYARPAAAGWRETDWAPYERDALVAGRRLHYLDVGSGERCFLLVHGFGGRWQHWLETIPTLASRGRVLAIDLPGFGASERPLGSPSLDGFADAASDLVSQLGIGRVVLAGHSMGGLVAIRFAARHPGLAEAIVPVAGAVFQFCDLLGLRNLRRLVVQRPREAVAIVMEIATAGLPAPAPVRRLVIQSRALRRLMLSPYVLDPVSLPDDVARIIVDGAGAPGVFPTARAIAANDPRAGIDRVACPVLSIAPAQDRIVPLPDAEALHRHLPRAETVVLDGCGHMPMLERARTLNRLLVEFADQL